MYNAGIVKLCFTPPPPKEYESLSQRDGVGPDVWCNLACCNFMLGLYKEADTLCEKGIPTACS
jgi:intraflagellar transport protein 56